MDSKDERENAVVEDKTCKGISIKPKITAKNKE
jgi:hypothetical protein